MSPRDHGIEAKIRFNHRVVGAPWSSADARWTMEARRGDTNETVLMTCAFLRGTLGERGHQRHRVAPLPITTTRLSA